jgi:hypothetical protein
MSMSLPRIRQAVLAVTTLEPAVATLRERLGRWTEEPFRDEGVDRFGLENVVFAIGDSFLEVLAPVRPETAVGRHLTRRGDDAGYMVMLQVTDMAATRRRLADLDVRIVWQTELADAVDLHLHPHDVPGALVAVDTMDPPWSWRWGGPGFVGTGARAPTASGGGLLGVTLAVPDPAGAAARWAAVAGLAPPTGTGLELGDRQRIDFVAATDERAGLVAIDLALPGAQTDTLHFGRTTIGIHPLTAEAAHG